MLDYRALLLEIQQGKGDNTHMGYTKRALFGFSANTILRGVSLVVAAAKLLLVYRWLGPTEVGLFSLISIALGISESATETGINLIILRATKPISYYLNTAWIVSIVRSWLVGGLILIMGAMMSYAYHQPTLFWLGLVAAMVPIVKGFINPAVISWQKELKFGADTWYRGSLIVIDALSAIVISFFFPFAQALLLAMILTAIYEVFFSFLFAKPKPKLKFELKVWQEIRQQGSWLNAQSVLSYLSENLDNLMVGWLTNVSTLGLYHTAYGVGHKVTFEVAKSVNHSTLPIYAKISQDRERLHKAFVKTFFMAVALIAVMSIPIAIWPQLVTFSLGSEWLGIKPILTLFVLAGFSQTLSLLIYAPLLALKKDKVVVTYQLFQVTSMAILMYSLVPKYGLMGAGMALVISRLFGLPIIWLKTQQLWRK